MTRLLVIPAAGRGSRLGWDGPKGLCPVGGRPMIEWLMDRYAPFVDRAVIVASPAGEPAFRRHLAGAALQTDVVVQAEPTGMLPAVLCAGDLVAAHQPDQIWITWCDQVGISAGTVQRLADELGPASDAALVFPTVRQSPPYIHFIRDAGGRIVRVLHRRDGDDMPASGESDAGLFGLRRDTYISALTTYDTLAPAVGSALERNFLPFIPWLAARSIVRTFAIDDVREAVGVNTPADLAAMERYLDGRV